MLPIYTFGAEVLRDPATEIAEDSPELQTLIDNMIETMHGAYGIGLAGPQVGVGQRIFVVDLSSLQEDLEADGEEVPEQPMVFINPEIVAESVEQTNFEEGCLSIPDIREDVSRPVAVEIEYTDRNWKRQKLTASGMLARVVQHEYDHLDGVLFVDYLTSFRKRLLKRRLKEMADGLVEADYPLAD